MFWMDTISSDQTVSSSPFFSKRETTLIAHTYVQIARVQWKKFESAIEDYPKDRHVWHYVKGILKPLVLTLKERVGLDLCQQEKHERAVEDFVKNMDVDEMHKNKERPPQKNHNG